MFATLASWNSSPRPLTSKNPDTRRSEDHFSTSTTATSTSSRPKANWLARALANPEKIHERIKEAPRIEDARSQLFTTKLFYPFALTATTTPPSISPVG